MLLAELWEDLVLNETGMVVSRCDYQSKECRKGYRVINTEIQVYHLQLNVVGKYYLKM